MRKAPPPPRGLCPPPAQARPGYARPGGPPNRTTRNIIFITQHRSMDASRTSWLCHGAITRAARPHPGRGEPPLHPNSKSYSPPPLAREGSLGSPSAREAGTKSLSQPPVAKTWVATIYQAVRFARASVRRDDETVPTSRGRGSLTALRLTQKSTKPQERGNSG